MEKKFDWGKLLKVIIAVLTAVAGSLGIVSCIS
ncbi:MAG: smalltalk protein [Bacteroidaceae bacterium]|nr:smalltalk protein [Bacteroidaceae bacterium]